eukprot:1182716-Prorocentrum_minimum.AAC.3
MELTGRYVTVTIDAYDVPSSMHEQISEENDIMFEVESMEDVLARKKPHQLGKHAVHAQCDK